MVFKYNTGKHLQLTNSYSIKGLRQLCEVIDYAYFDDDLYLLLTNNESRNVLKTSLYNTYFNEHFIEQDLCNSYFRQIEDLILNEPPVVYKKEISTLDEDEIFIRKGAFKKIVPKIYNQSCCISGMRIVSSHEIQMIDACHIVPFYESHDDTITNGISLCPNLHRAFDRGLIMIDREYRIQISNKFSEGSLDYSIIQFQNKSLLLPIEKRYYPSIENLKWHAQNIFL